MTGLGAYITGMGAVTSAGLGTGPLKKMILEGKSALGPLTLFHVRPEHLFPVGSVVDSFTEEVDAGLPRTHRLALAAAREAAGSAEYPPDAVIIGVTTGGMLSTEEGLKSGWTERSDYRWHAAGSVAECVAGRHGCKGPAITISNACSSGAAALVIALEMLRTGRARRVLAGGADCLCRLTYHGFRSLQLIDPCGARPLDIHRRGMSVGEGAALLFLEGSETRPDNAVAQILGGGLSCDAYHPTRPCPDGEGAFAAMADAIRDADLSPSDIDYINLHSPGTLDNDLSEAKAIQKLTAGKVPPLSSVKGALGHSLAASGGVEAAVSVISLSERVIPASVGCVEPDPALGFDPVAIPLKADLKFVLSNSFGFGGNNAAIVVGRPSAGSVSRLKPLKPLSVIGFDCITGSGNIHKTADRIMRGGHCGGILSLSELSEALDPGAVRRLKRLPRMALALAAGAHKNAGVSESPSAVFFGTGWGALSETFDFIKRLYDSDEKFASPTDFVGSVHNAPAGQAALHFGSKGPNITAAGGDQSFEQALTAASLLADRTAGPFIVMGADEFHETLSPLFDPSVSCGVRSDGGGAFCLAAGGDDSGLTIWPAFFESADHHPDVISALVETLGGPETVGERFGGILVGIPNVCRPKSETRLQAFLSFTRFTGPVIDYRRFTGEFASASATAAVLAAAFVQNGEIPDGLRPGSSVPLNGKGVLVLGFGKFITAVEII